MERFILFVPVAVTVGSIQLVRGTQLLQGRVPFVGDKRDPAVVTIVAGLAWLLAAATYWFFDETLMTTTVLITMLGIVVLCSGYSWWFRRRFSPNGGEEGESP